jgi:catalase
VPGIDFTNDPLLQGRLFSYLDTQLKPPGHDQLPPDADQRAQVPGDELPARRHMQMAVPKGRANYEPNSLSETAGEGRAARMPDDRLHHGPGADLARASRATSCASGPRASPITTARRGCSSARCPAEQAHLASALVFELSKVGHRGMCGRG